MKFFNQDENLYALVFVMVLSIGCFWQIYSVCDLFFKYPTNVFIETNFDPLTKEVPALTFVKNIRLRSGENSTVAMETDSSKIKNQLFSRIYIYNSTGTYDLKKEYLDNAVERISLSYYSITFNSLLTG